MNNWRKGSDFFIKEDRLILTGKPVLDSGVPFWGFEVCRSCQPVVVTPTLWSRELSIGLTSSRKVKIPSLEG